MGARIVWWKVRDDSRLHVADVEALVSNRTRLVACTAASNATGTRVDVAGVTQVAHAAGAEVFVDAVHFAPHGSIDVQSLDCDYLVCSGYKIFSPHMGFAWCRSEAIDRLPIFREDFIPDVTPDKLEAGTYAYENVAGMEAVVEYLARLGRCFTATPEASRAVVVRAAMEAIAAYERTLAQALVDAVLSIDGAIVHGVVDRQHIVERVPTVSFTVRDIVPAAIAAALALRGVGARSGHMYAPRLMQRLKLMPGGTVRVSLVHYNTLAEVSRFRDALDDTIADIGSPVIHRRT